MGELHRIRGELAAAEQKPALLDKACFLPCGACSDLKEAVARCKANGMRWQPE
ncbi:MAG TPA: hypothetical protein VJN44_16270 [Roseateles sp.]|nr:hypothetical protein [Roseateles sp.]